MPLRQDTVRDYRERINRVLLYIEDHLDERLPLVDLAKVACFSPYHFHRIFVAFTSEPLAAYVRRLRLERSAQKLLHLDAPVTEIALGAGYETPAAFTRAFAGHFGVNPTEYRQEKKSILLFGARLLALAADTEECTMTPELRTIEPLPVLFVRRTGPYAQAAEAAFKVLCQFAGARGLLGPATRFIGISHDDPHITEQAKFRYDACLTIEGSVKTEGEVEQKTIAGGRYAVFLHAGSYQGLSQTYDEIFGAWLPSSGQRLKEDPGFELYLNSPGQVKPEDLRTEIWVPLW